MPKKRKKEKIKNESTKSTIKEQVKPYFLTVLKQRPTILTQNMREKLGKEISKVKYYIFLFTFLGSREIDI